MPRHSSSFPILCSAILILFIAVTPTLPAAEPGRERIATGLPATVQIPTTFHVARDDEKTLFIMPRKKDMNGPISMRMSCLNDLAGEKLSNADYVALLKRLNDTDKVKKIGPHLSSSATVRETAPDGTNWLFRHFSVIADDMLVTITVQVIVGRENEPQCKELSDAFDTIVASIKRQ